MDLVFQGPTPTRRALYISERGGALGAVELLFTAGVQYVTNVTPMDSLPPFCAYGRVRRANKCGLGRFVAIIGSLAILLGMLWGPFTQNPISYESKDITVPDGVALATRSVVYAGLGTLTAISGKDG